MKLQILHILAKVYFKFIILNSVLTIFLTGSYDIVLAIYDIWGKGSFIKRRSDGRPF